MNETNDTAPAVKTRKIRDARTYRWARRQGHRALNKALRADNQPEIGWLTFNLPGPYQIGASSGERMTFSPSLRRALRGRTYLYSPQLPKSQRRSRHAA